MDPEILHVTFLLLVVALQEVRATELTRQEEGKVTEEHQERLLGNAGQRRQGLCREKSGLG